MWHKYGLTYATKDHHLFPPFLLHYPTSLPHCLCCIPNEPLGDRLDSWFCSVQSPLPQCSTAPCQHHKYHVVGETSWVEIRTTMRHILSSGISTCPTISYHSHHKTLGMYLVPNPKPYLHHTGITHQLHTGLSLAIHLASVLAYLSFVTDAQMLHFCIYFPSCYH